MNIDQATKRLAFIKYLQKVSEEQAKKAEPMCWTAILTLHDSVELYLQLIAEFANINQKIVNFMDYWAQVNPELKVIGKLELTQRIAMERLNKARVDFKHYGNAPSRSSLLEDFVPNVKNFFEENTREIFGIKFSDVSLINLLSCESAKKDLKKAGEFQNEGKLAEALQQVAIAFAELIDDYKKRKTDQWGYSPFDFGKDMTFLSSFHISVDGKFGEFIDKTRQSIEALQEAIAIIGFGIDFKRYGMFRVLTPHVYHYADGHFEAIAIDEEYGRKITADNVAFCIGFVIESALSLQEFDFALAQEGYLKDSMF